MLAIIGKSRASGCIAAPPSKSMAHRLLIAAGLCEGTSKIAGVSMSEDVAATVDALRAFGAVVDIDDDVLAVTGMDITKAGVKSVINCRESGSTLRFFVPVAMTGDRPVSFTGHGRLLSRPLGIYEDIAKKQGLLFKNDGEKVTVCGSLKSGEYEVKGNISSQFISGLIFALPLLHGDSKIKMIPPVESRPYIDMTLDAVSGYGIKYRICGNMIEIPGDQRYMPKDAAVEGDYSNAAYLEAFNSAGGDVTVTGLNSDSLQGDKVYKDLFEQIIKGGGSFTADISQCPDLGPVLMSLMALHGGGKLTGTRRLREKESDRCEAMRRELEKLGIDLTVCENEIIVHPGIVKRPETALDSHNDHRIAMALAVICSTVGGEISECQAVNKSYGSFWQDIKSLGIDVEIREER